MPKIQPKITDNEALKHIYNNQRGYMKDLKHNIGTELVSEFKSIGFIKSGFTRKAETYKTTKLGNAYIKDMGLDVII